MRTVSIHVALFLALIGSAVAVHFGIHALGLDGWIRGLGIVGTLMILLSFAYSLRKRTVLRAGRPPAYLRAHELLAWSGAMLVLVHGGAHLHAILPWLAQIALLVVVASGLIGKYTLRGARESLAARREELAGSGLSRNEIEARMFMQALVVRRMASWRRVHIPLTLAFAVLVLAHAVTASMFWRW